MATKPFNYLCIHAHFDQPSRSNVVTGIVGEEDGAAPYANLYERVTAQSYHPNAEMGNFDRISYDFGNVLLQWLEQNNTATYQRIIQSDHGLYKQAKVGNALANPYYHVILPLLKRRDKITLLQWGAAAFRHHFKHEPQGLWLPELAVDLRTLQVAHDLGYRYTILTQGQVEGANEGAGPYWVDLPNGEKFAVYVRNDDLSNNLSFNISDYGGAGHWARQRLTGRTLGPLTLLAVEGETFGHHHIGEEQFLHWLLEHEAEAVGYKVITLSEYLDLFPPTQTISIKLFSSWSCFHGLARWMMGCACTHYDNAWKAPFLFNIMHIGELVDELYIQACRDYNVDPWSLRNAYISVILEEKTGEALLKEFIQNLTPEIEQKLLTLLKAESMVLRSYGSEALKHESYERPATYDAIASIGYAAELAQQATGVTVVASVRNWLNLIPRANSQRTCLDIYQDIGEQHGFIPKAVADFEELVDDTEQAAPSGLESATDEFPSQS